MSAPTLSPHRACFSAASPSPLQTVPPGPHLLRAVDKGYDSCAGQLATGPFPPGETVLPLVTRTSQRGKVLTLETPGSQHPQGLGLLSFMPNEFLGTVMKFRVHTASLSLAQRKPASCWTRQMAGEV